jgi:enoyl-CoA hydratase/carnithine racemase
MQERFSEITCERRDGVALVSLNRPGIRNPLSLTLADNLMGLFDELEADDGIGAVVLTGAGTVFCSGAQLGEVVSPDGIDSEIQFRNIRGFSRLVQRIRDLDLPVIAALNGPAIGGGAALALACDVVLGSEKASYNFAFGRVGAGANDMGCAYFLPKLVGSARARHWLLTGASVMAEDAYKAGLLVEVVSPDQLVDRAIDLARSVMSASPRRATAVTKLAINRAEDADLQTCLSYEVYLQTFLFTREEHRDRLKKLLNRLGSG